MTNGNDFLIIEEQNYESILEDYIKDLKDGLEEVPDDFKLRWIELYLEDE